MTQTRPRAPAHIGPTDRERSCRRLAPVAKELEEARIDTEADMTGAMVEVRYD